MSFFGQTTNEPKKKKSLGSINEDNLNSSEQVQPITYMAGRRYVAGQFISPGYNEVIKDIKGTTGKGESGTTGHVYFCDFGLVWGMGGRRPFDAIFKLIEESEIIWKNDAGILRGSAESEDITIDKKGQARIYWGSETQPIDDLVFTTRGVIPVDPDFDPRDKSTWTRDDSAGVDDPLHGHYDVHPRYPAQCFTVHKKWKLGRDRGAIPNLQAELMRGVPWFTASTQNRDAIGFNSDARGVNPIGVLFESLTDRRFGRGWPEARLSQAKFENVAGAIGGGMRISPLVTSQAEFRSFIEKLLEYFDGFLRISGGQLEVGYFGHGALNLGALPVLTDNDLDGEPELKPNTYSDAFTRLQVSISDRNHNYQRMTGGKFDNLAMQRIIGQPQPIWIDREWLTDPDLGKQVAAEEGNMRSRPHQEGTLAVKREWLDTAIAGKVVLPGQQFVWNSVSRGYSFVLRINKVRTLAPPSGRAELTIENERGYWPTVFVPPSVDTAGDFHVAAVAITNGQIIQLPLGLRDDPSKIEVAAFAQRARVEMRRFNVWFSSDGATYNLISTDNQFGVYGTLAADYGVTGMYDDATGLQVYLYGPGLEEIVSQTSAQRENNDLLLFIDYVFGPFVTSTPEIMSVGAVIALGGGLYKLFVKRGRFGTAIASHPGPASTGGPAHIWLMFRGRITPIWDLNFTPGFDNHFKLQTYTAIDELDIADAGTLLWDYFPRGNPGAPVVSPAGGTFSGFLGVSVSYELSTGLRYTVDGTPVSEEASTWPISGGNYANVAINSSCVMRLRGFFPDGSPATEEVHFAFTQVPAGAVGPSVAAPVRFAYTGQRGQTSGNLTIIGPTPASTIHYSKNGAAFATYSGPLALVVGDIVEAYETAAGFADSVVSRFSNEAIGGGYDPARAGGLLPHPQQ